MGKYSHSKISTFMACPKKYDYIYNQKLKPIGHKEPLILGSAVHKGIEYGDPIKAVEYLNSIENEASEQNETLKVIAEAMVTGYLKLFGRRDIKKREMIVDVPIGDGDYLYGIVDEIEQQDDLLFICDIKTTSSIGDPLKYKDQLLKYYYAAKKQGFDVDGIKVRMIKKPGIRQKKNETIEQFRSRILDEYLNLPEKYYKEEEIPFSDIEVTDTLVDFKGGIQFLKLAKNAGIYPKNLSHCGNFGGCEFLPLCRGEIDAIFLYDKKESEED